MDQKKVIDSGNLPHATFLNDFCNWVTSVWPDRLSFSMRLIFFENFIDIVFNHRYFQLTYETVIFIITVSK